MTQPTSANTQDNETHPPVHLREPGEKEWYKEHKVLCDKGCGSRATIRYHKQNICRACLCPDEMPEEYLEALRTRWLYPSSSIALCAEG